LWKPGPEKQYYQIVTRRFAEFSSQKAAREAHQNEQALARTRLRLSRRPIFDASGKPHFRDLLAGHAGRRASCAALSPSRRNFRSCKKGRSMRLRRLTFANRRFPAMPS
jgi:hypothetical protein